MGRPSKDPDELRERAVRMVAEVRPQYPSQWRRSPGGTGHVGHRNPGDAADLNPAFGGRLGLEAGCDVADG